MDKNKVKCPFCGHEQKIQYTPDAKCRGVFIRCQGRHCKKEFEIAVKKGRRIIPVGSTGYMAKDCWMKLNHSRQNMYTYKNVMSILKK